MTRYFTGKSARAGLALLSIQLFTPAAVAQHQGREHGASPAAATATRVAHGVTQNYQQGDTFPVYGSQVVTVSNAEPYYDPAAIDVHVGDIVHWTNKPVSDTHTVMNPTGTFASNDIKAGSDWCYHFVREGDYAYTCRFHPWMRGLVRVTRRDVVLRPDAALQGRATALLSAKRTLELPAGARMNVLVADSGRTVTAVPGGLFISSGGTRDRIDLPNGMQAGAAAFGNGTSLWVASADGKALASVDLTTKAVKPRSLPAGAKIVALRQTGEGDVWALDAGRGALLKIGASWIAETQLPADARSAASLAVDREGRVWFASRNKPGVGLLQRNGMVEQFRVPEGSRPELVQLRSGEVLLADAATGRVAGVVTVPPAQELNGPLPGNGCPVALTSQLTDPSAGPGVHDDHRNR